MHLHSIFMSFVSWSFCATTACTFSTCRRPKVLRAWGAFTFWFRNLLRATTACTFQHLIFRKCSDVVVFCTFLFRHVLRATTACNFSSLISPDGSAPAALASLLFDLRSHKSVEKHNVPRFNYLVALLHLLSSDPLSPFIFFLLFFSSLTLHTFAFHLSILSEVSLLNFLRW